MPTFQFSETIRKVLRQWPWAVVLIAVLSVIGTFTIQQWHTSPSERTRASRQMSLRVGDHLADVSLEALSGSATTLSWQTDLPTVIYVFSPACIWCKMNLTAAKGLIAGVTGRYRVVGISPTRVGLSDYLRKAHFELPVYVMAPKQNSLHLTKTPETIVVSKDGTVTNVWLGAYSKPIAGDIFHTLGVRVASIDE